MKVSKLDGYNDVTVVEINKSEIDKVDFALCKQPKETLSQYYNRQDVKPDFLMNGGFFVMSSGDTIFNLIDEKKTISSSTYYKEGIGITDDDKLIFGTYDSKDWRDFINAYPPLIVDGKKVAITYAKDIDYKARRSVLAYNNDKIFLVAVEGQGMGFAELQTALMKIGCTYAINLDGGGSTKILQNGKSITSVLHNRAIDNVVAVYLKKANAVIHRVQAGAFTNKNYAIAFRDKIRSLGGDYAGAYIRLIDGKYKVQVGAFSKVDNAKNFEKGLKTLGIDCYITTI